MPKDIEFVLKDFVRHVVNLKAEDDPAGTGFHREFRLLREEQIQNRNEDRFPTEDGKREENLKKNRYKDILPRDDRRVKLKETEGEKGSDYINASFIDDVDGEKGYIAAQGPMPHTVGDFWRMLLQYRAEIVFMVCKLKEDGRPKCEKYWADNGQSATFGDITIHTESEEEIQEYFFRRQLRAERKGESHTLTQFHYVGWPDHNIPSSPDVLRTMIEDVRNYRKHLDIPMVVHCSAGCGRTGTICAIDFAWTLLDRGMITEEFSMFEIIKSMREQRMSMVQTPDQYEYTHMVMKSLCNEWLTSYSNHDYENITFGEPLGEDEDADEPYANIEFDTDSRQNGEPTTKAEVKVVTMPEATKEVEKLVSSSQPEQLQNSSPQPKAPEETPKPKPADHKPAAGDVVPIAASSRTAATMVIADQSKDTGEYVEVVKTATVAPSSTVTQSASSPSNAEAQKNSTTSGAKSSEVQKKNSTTTSAAGGTDPQRKPSTTSSASTDHQRKPSTTSSGSNDSDPHKTVIMLGSGSAVPKIIKTGSVGVSHTKQQAPKPPAQAVVKPVVASGQQQQQQQKEKQQQTAVNEARGVERQTVASGQQQQQQKQQQTAVNEARSVEVAKRGPELERQKIAGQNSARKTSNSALSDEDAPDLPTRNYRPEEISSPPNSPTSKTTTPIPQSTTATATATAASATKVPATSPPQSTAPSSTPAADLNRDRPPQPLPVSLPPAQGIKVVSAKTGQLVSSGPVVSAKSSGQGANPRPAGQGVVVAVSRPAGPASHTMPGVVTVMGGASHRQAAPRVQPVVVKSADSRSLGHPTQPVAVSTHGKGPAPRKGPMMLQHAHHPNAAGLKGHHVVTVPPGAQVVRTAHGTKIIYPTDRPPRVRGPKDMPAGWVTPKNHRGGTYL